jgi:ABC-2 type transport system permease protein
MRWLAVARKDFENAARAYLVWGVAGVLAALVVLIVAIPGLVGNFSARLAFEATTQAVGTVVPIVALVAAYLSVAGERESGTLRILLSLPPSRRDVVLGKFLARAALVVASILLAFALGVVASLLVYGTVPLDVAVGTAGLTCLLGVSFVGIAVGVSASVGSRARAVALAVGFFVLTVVLWSPLLLAMRVLLELPLQGGAQPDWVLFLESFPPSSAFGRLYDSVVGSLLPGGPAASDSVFLSDGAMLAVLAFWTLVPLALGYWRFERADLG